MQKKKIIDALLGSIFVVASAGYAISNHLRSDEQSEFNFFNNDEFAHKSDEAFNERFRSATDAEIEELGKPIVFDMAPCPTKDLPNRDCAVVRKPAP